MWSSRNRHKIVAIILTFAVTNSGFNASSRATGKANRYRHDQPQKSATRQ